MSRPYPLNIALRVARVVSGLNMNQLAEIADTHAHHLHRIESGQVRPSSVLLAALRAGLMGELEVAEAVYGTIETRERGNRSRSKCTAS